MEYQKVTDLEFKLAIFDVNRRQNTVSKEDPFFKINPERHVRFVKLIKSDILGKLFLNYWTEFSDMLIKISKERFND